MSTQAVRRAFDELAPTYDEDFTGSLIGRLQRQAFWRILRGEIDGGTILDLGCGTGEDAVRLAKRACRVDALDVSPEMIAERFGELSDLTDAVPLDNAFEALKKLHDKVNPEG